MKNNILLLFTFIGTIACHDAVAGCHCNDGTNWKYCADLWCADKQSNDCMEVACSDGGGKICIDASTYHYGEIDYDAFVCGTWQDVSGSPGLQTRMYNGTEIRRCKPGYQGEAIENFLEYCNRCDDFQFSEIQGAVTSDISGRVVFLQYCTYPQPGYYATGCDASGDLCTGQNVCEQGYFCNLGRKTQCQDDGTTESEGASSQSQCYITTFTDEKGSGTYGNKCYWSD